MSSARLSYELVWQFACGIRMRLCGLATHKLLFCCRQPTATVVPKKSILLNVGYHTRKPSLRRNSPPASWACSLSAWGSALPAHPSVHGVGVGSMGSHLAQLRPVGDRNVPLLYRSWLFFFMARIYKHYKLKRLCSPSTMFQCQDPPPM